jgi:hypothetical protein
MSDELPKLSIVCPDNYQRRVQIIEDYTEDRFGVYPEESAAPGWQRLPKAWAALLADFWAEHLKCRKVNPAPDAPAAHKQAVFSYTALRMFASGGGWPGNEVPAALASTFWQHQRKLADALTALQPWMSKTEHVADITKRVATGVARTVGETVAEAAKPAAEAASTVLWPLAAAGAAVALVMLVNKKR